MSGIYNLPDVLLHRILHIADISPSVCNLVCRAWNSATPSLYLNEIQLTDPLKEPARHAAKKWFDKYIDASFYAVICDNGWILSQVSRLKNIDYLVWEGDPDAFSLQSCVHITELVLTMTSFYPFPNHIVDLQSMAYLTNLQALTLNPTVTIKSFTPLSVLTKLTTLVFDDTQDATFATPDFASVRDWHSLSALRSLNTLHISAHDIPSTPSGLRTLSRLSCLSLTDLSVNAFELREIPRYVLCLELNSCLLAHNVSSPEHALTCLTMTHTDSRDLENLPGFVHLRRLTLFDQMMDVHSHGWKCLTECTNLKYFRLERCNVAVLEGDEQFALPLPPQLEELVIRNLNTRDIWSPIFRFALPLTLKILRLCLQSYAFMCRRARVVNPLDLLDILGGLGGLYVDYLTDRKLLHRAVIHDHLIDL